MLTFSAMKQNKMKLSENIMTCDITAGLCCTLNKKSNWCDFQHFWNKPYFCQLTSLIIFLMTVISQCDPNPCQNNGFCKSVAGSCTEYECSCALCFQGATCDIRKSSLIPQFTSDISIYWSPVLHPAKDRERLRPYYLRDFIGYVVLKIGRHASRLAS